MLIFNTVDDAMNADIDTNIKAYLLSYISKILKSYEENSLKKVGSIYFFDESDKQKEQLKHSKIEWEYTEIINIRNPATSVIVSVVHGIAVKNNECAIDVFIPLDSPDNELKKSMIDFADESFEVNL